MKQTKILNKDGNPFKRLRSRNSEQEYVEYSIDTVDDGYPYMIMGGSMIDHARAQFPTLYNLS